MATDQIIRRIVMLKRGDVLALEFRNDALGQYLAQFDAPLIEGIDTPDHTLRKHDVFIEGDQFTQRFRSEPLEKEGIGWTVPLKDSMRNTPS